MAFYIDNAGQYHFDEQDDQNSGSSNSSPSTQPASAPIRYGSDLEAQAKALYGSSWDADAAQQFAYRQSKGQSPEEILQHTAEDYAQRFPSSPSSGGSSAPAFRNTSPGYTDPSQRLIEDSALARYAQLQNPPQGSGQNLYEQEIKNLIETLKGPVYSAGDEATIKAGAMDTIFRDRDQTKQRWLEEVSRRGLSPSSGPALEGLRRIDEHYKTLQTTVDAQFARDAIDQTRAQRQQVVSNAGLLAGTENARLDQALDVARIPYGLTNDAFARNLSLVNAGGSPSSLLSSALQLYGANQQADAYNSQQRQALANGLLQYLGYLYG